MWTKAFWLAVLERAVKSAAQAAVLVIGAEQVNAVTGIDWADIGGFALGGAVLSVLTSVSSGAVTSTAGPSLTNAEVLPAEEP